MAEIAALVAAAGSGAAAAGTAAAGVIGASTLAQGALMGAAIGGGIPALTGGNRHEILRGLAAGAVTGGAGAGISGLASGQTMAQLLGAGEAAAGAGAAGAGGNFGMDPSALQISNQMGLYDPSTLTSGLSDVSTLGGPQVSGLGPNLTPEGIKEATQVGQEALRDLGSSPSKTMLDTMRNVQPTSTAPSTNLFDNPLKYAMENPKTAIYSGLAGAMAGQPRYEPPKKKKYESPYVWQNPLTNFRFANGGIASLPGYDKIVGEMPMYARGGVSDLGTYSDGGRMLKGPGDGMSDSIPGVIAGKRPARLADSEFVVPADVVSHLGNGSTDAGAKQLYKMMDRVRVARTGTKKQGRQINPVKYLPA